MTTGFRILRRERKVSSDLVTRFAALPVANVSDSMGRMTAAGPRLTKMHRDGMLAGPALTVKARPGDNLMLHKAIDMAAPGDVIVVDAGGDITATKVADFLILNGESPRSLLTSLYEAVWHLDGLARRYGDQVPATAKTKAHETLDALVAHDIERIFDDGLHEFLSWFINEVGGISSAVHDDYLSGRM